MGRICVCGSIESEAFQKAKRIAEAVRIAAGEKLEVEIRELFEVDWEHYLQEARKDFSPHTLLSLQDALMCVHDSHGFIGGLSELQQWVSQRYPLVSTSEGDPVDATQLIKQSFIDYVRKSENVFVYIKIKLREEPLGMLVFELDSSLPKTCENFKSLCTGECGTAADGTKLHYLNCTIHRIVKDGWIQSGDITSGNGDRSMSIYGRVFEDESFQMKHDRAGILSMANNGAHSNGSQFFVTLRDLEYLDTHKVAFGKLIYGYETLKKLGKVPTTNERPSRPTIISECGVFDPTTI